MFKPCAGIRVDALRINVPMLPRPRPELPDIDRVHHAPQALIDWMYSEYEPVFVLSTGRAGSNFLARLLAQCEDVQAYHEAEPRLQYFARRCFQDPQAPEWERVIDAARMELVLDACVRRKRYVECNHALVPFAPALSRLFARSKFVQLVRDPCDFVRSAIRIGFHASDTVWESGRVRLADAERWEQMSLLERLGWYWSAIYRFTEELGQNLSPERFLRVRYEKLFNGEAEIRRIQEFIGTTCLSADAIRESQAVKVNTLESMGGERSSLVRRTVFPMPSCWEPAQVAEVERYVQPLASQLGYTMPRTAHPALPLLTVLIPNFNNAEFLPRCLDSVLEQTYPRLEILVVDDCSTDNSREILEEYRRRFPERMRLLLLPENQGVARARNHGLEAARGELLSTLDADDFLLAPEKLEQEARLVLRHKEQSGKDVIAFSNIMVADADGNVLGPQFGEASLREGFIGPQLLSRSCMVPRDFVTYRHLYQDAGGYDPRYTTHEDWNLKIKLATRAGYYFTGLPGVAYRRHGGGLSSAPYWERLRNLTCVFEENLREVGDPEFRKEIQQQFGQFLAQHARSQGRVQAVPTELEELRKAAAERLALIEQLQKTCDERLDLIGRLHEAAAEQRAEIRKLQRPSPLSWLRRRWRPAGDQKP